jgi:opacity protein-like surface antigen
MEAVLRRFFAISIPASILAMSAVVFTPSTALAQSRGATGGQSGVADEADLAASSWELGVHAGPLLPSRIPYVREIVQGWGGRVAIPTAKGVFEIDNVHARGSGIVYNTLSLDYRADIKNDYLPTHFLIGFHGDYFHGPERGFTYAGGWHFGGGLTEKLAGPVYFRTDFKYRFSPGTSLYVGIGVSYRFGSGKGG